MQEIKEIEMYSEINVRAKLPNKSWGFPLPDHIEIPYCNPENIKQVVNQTLAQIEGLRGEYDEEKCMWALEYGTKPMIWYARDDLDFKKMEIIQIQQAATRLAEKKAFKKFQHNAHEYGFDEGYAPYPGSGFPSRKWTRIQIFLSYDEEKNVILVELNRFTGNHRELYYDVLRKIKDTLKAMSCNSA